MEPARDFVDGLKRELPAWQADGIVSPSAARALSARYELGPADGPRDRSGPLAAAAGVVIALALGAALLVSGIGDGVVLPLTALAAAYAATPLVVRGAAFVSAAEALRIEGRILFYVAAFALSFVRIAEATRFRSGLASEGLLASVPPLLGAIAAVAAGLRRTDVDAHVRGEAMLLVATVVAFAAGLSLDTGDGTATVATMSLAFLAVGRIVRGLSWLARGAFLEGIGIATLLAGARAFNMFPASWIAWVVAGACVVVAAGAVAGFERRRARSSAPQILGP